MVLFEEDTSTWKCRVCGCTDATPCPSGCAWVEKDLCSQCVDKPEAKVKPLEAKTTKDIVFENTIGRYANVSVRVAGVEWFKKKDNLSLLPYLRRVHCTCDDGSLCSGYDPKGITAECQESCEGFCRMWGEVERLLGAK